MTHSIIIRITLEGYIHKEMDYKSMGRIKENQKNIEENCY